MTTRTLGNSNLEVSAIGLGCMGMSLSYGLPKDKQEMTALLRGAVEREITFFEASAAKITVQGAPYPEKLQQMTGRCAERRAACERGVHYGNQTKWLTAIK